MIEIDQLQKKLKELQKEIEEFQNNCSHRKTHIQAQKDNDIRIVCVACRKVLGWPNYNELQKWLKK